MRIDNYSNGEVKLKKTVKTASLAALLGGTAKGVSMLHNQHCAIKNLTPALKKANEKKELASELANQFFDKSPKIRKIILKPFEDKIEFLKTTSAKQKFDFKTIINSTLKTAGKAAIVTAVLYLVISFLDNLFDTD